MYRFKQEKKKKETVDIFPTVTGKIENERGNNPKHKFIKGAYRTKLNGK